MAKVAGIDAVLQSLKGAATDWQKAMAGAIYQEGLALIADSIPQVPVQTSRLKNSNYVQKPDSIENPVVRVGYNTDYAYWVHERTELYHRVGKAKFLEDPMNARKVGYVDRLIARAQKLFKAKRGLDVDTED